MSSPAHSFQGLVRRFFLSFVLIAVLTAAHADRGMADYILNYTTPVDSELQNRLATIDADLRERHGMNTENTAVGLLDLKKLRLALINPDQMTYGASVPKIAILLAYFQLKPEAVRELDPEVREALGLMVKTSSNELAARFSQELGLKEIQKVVESYGFYEAERGGGIWVGKHYGIDGERYGDPVGDHSHGVTVRQVLRFYLLLEQGKLVSPEASEGMRKIFASPELPHDEIKFVKALADREVQLLRKWGSWRNWLHDSAIITGSDRHYILVALTEHPNGDEYLVDLATAIDDLFIAEMTAAR